MKVGSVVKEKGMKVKGELFSITMIQTLELLRLVKKYIMERSDVVQ